MYEYVMEQLQVYSLTVTTGPLPDTAALMYNVKRDFWVNK